MSEQEIEYSPEVLQADLRRARRLAQLMDSEFEIAGYRIGWDPIIGLIPGAGDFITTIIGLYPLILARKHKLGGRVLQSRMLLNLLVDFGVGSIPLAGDAFDAMYKSMLKNVALLERAAEKKLRQSA